MREVSHQQMQQFQLEKESRDCLCGRSPTGKCMSWHALSEKVYLQRKSQYELSAS
ncbi:hypothetical protein OAS27_05505 [Alphaproteobacteria bacterium]|nr:hypothetical protein [Alphaproteobacteria bacterium]